MQGAPAILLAPPSSMSLSVRSTSGSPAALSQSLADAISRLDRNAVVTFTPLKQQVDAALVQERILAMMAGFSGLLALLLAGLGLYGIVWYAVSRRRAEIGIRMALGATPANVARLVLSRTSLLVGTGITVGAVACWWMSRSIASLLYGVEPRDVATMASAAAILAIVGLVAAWMADAQGLSDRSDRGPAESVIWKSEIVIDLRFQIID